MDLKSLRVESARMLLGLPEHTLLLESEWTDLAHETGDIDYLKLAKVAKLRYASQCANVRAARPESALGRLLYSLTKKNRLKAQAEAYSAYTYARRKLIRQHHFRSDTNCCLFCGQTKESLVGHNFRDLEMCKGATDA